eukprot:106715_1
MGTVVVVLKLLWMVESHDCDSSPLHTYRTLREYKDNVRDEPPAQQILMTDEATQHGAYCLDGSVPDFYIRPGTDDGMNKFHIYLQGGGWCVGLDYCATRATTSLGSSTFDEPYANIAAGAPYLSSNQTTNSLSFNWNSIYVRYCDGLLYASNNETIYSYNASISLHFRGWRILNGVLNVLQQKYNLSKATDVLFSGCSAGGLATFWHGDYMYSKMVELTNNKAINYMAMPDAGYFMETEFQMKGMRWIWDWGNVSDGMNQNCVAYYKEYNMDESECLWAFNVAPFVKVKMFALQSQYDSNQVANMGPNSNNTVLVNELGQNITHWFLSRYTNTSSGHWGWLVSCFQHCNFGTNTWNDFMIDGYTISQVQVNAWFGNTTHSNLFFQNKTYPCTECC